MAIGLISTGGLLTVACWLEVEIVGLREICLIKLIPVPGMEKETQKVPLGDLPIRNPASPQLTPVPLGVIVVLTPPPRLIDFRQRKAICLFHKQTSTCKSVDRLGAYHQLLRQP